MSATDAVGKAAVFTALHLDMVALPRGEFLMGAGDREDGSEDCETPRHRVTIARPFAMSRTAVTFAQWDLYRADAGVAYCPSDEGWGRDDRPAVNLSWDDARGFVDWLAIISGRPFRLPSESEWEYAARAGTQTAFHWGDGFEAGRANCLDGAEAWTGRMTSPVGSYPANNFGLLDMLGNSWEWVEDCWNEFYRGAPADGSAWQAGMVEAHVLRGGSWCDPARLIRAAARNRHLHDFRCNDYGFRVAVDLPA